jgi:para-nitrobenzyl esterase
MHLALLWLLASAACGAPAPAAPPDGDVRPDGWPRSDARRDVDAIAPDGGSEPGVVHVESGRLRGLPSGAAYAYRGIPFARPPIGPLRWRAPQPATPWEGELLADRYGPACVQSHGPGHATGDEDCLKLNVWSPRARPEEPLPVLVWIHGGANTSGSSGDNAYRPGIVQPPHIYDGTFLVEQGPVVVVTLNYRVGALGYFVHPALDGEEGRPGGNYGILDQIAALRWVQRNIAAFGGDPTRVMIFGNSAGGQNSCALFATPAAGGLFSRAIMQSGLCFLPPCASSRDSGVALATALGCAGDADVVACLRSKPADDVAKAVLSDHTLAGIANFNPCVDGTLFPDTPLRLIEQGRHNDVPFIAGSNADEFALILDDALGRVISSEEEYVAQVKAIWGEALGALILAQYPASDHASPRAAMMSVLADLGYHCPTRRAVRAAARHSDAVWRYVYGHVLPHPALTFAGAFHSQELFFLFDGSGLPVDAEIPGSGYTFDAAERALAQSLARLWIGFAATGRPAPTEAWAPYDPADDNHLVIDEPLAAGAGWRSAHCDWADRVGL